MAQVQPYRNMAPLKLDGANTQIDLGGKITTLESKRWTPNHNVGQLQFLGTFSVMEHNSRTGSCLKFVNTYEGWYQRLPEDQGILHKLHLVATDKGVPGNYEACVWEKNCPLDWKKMNLPLDEDQMNLHLELVYFIRLCLGMAMGRVISGTRPAPPLMGWDIIFLNGYRTGLRFFLKPGAGSGRVRVLPHPAPIIYKIKIKIKFNLKFKIKLI